MCFSSYAVNIFWEINPIKLNHFIPCVVHELRPGDIKVVAAVGDSLTVSICLLPLFFNTVYIKNKTTDVKNWANCVCIVCVWMYGHANMTTKKKWWSNFNFNTEKWPADICAVACNPHNCIICFSFNKCFLCVHGLPISHLMFSAGSQWCGCKGKQPSVSDDWVQRLVMEVR